MCTLWSYGNGSMNGLCPAIDEANAQEALTKVQATFGRHLARSKLWSCIEVSWMPQQAAERALQPRMAGIL